MFKALVLELLRGVIEKCSEMEESSCDRLEVEESSCDSPACRVLEVRGQSGERGERGER
jgi:hypothetical protein